MGAKTLLSAVLILAILVSGCTNENTDYPAANFTCLDICESYPHPIVSGFNWNISGTFPECNCSYYVISEEPNNTIVEAPGRGVLDLFSTPLNASVYLNNIYKGSTPLLLTNLHTGSYSLRLEKEGYNTLLTSVYIGLTNVSLNLALTHLNISNIFFSFETDDASCPQCYSITDWKSSGAGDNCFSHCVNIVNNISNMLRLVDSEKSTLVYAYYDFPKSAASGNITFYIKIVFDSYYPQYYDSGKFYMWISEDDSTESNRIDFAAASRDGSNFKIDYLGGSSILYPSNEWCKVNIQFNTTSRVWNLFVNDELVVKDLFLASNGAIDRIRFQSSDNNWNGYTVYLDNIAVSIQ